MFVAPSAEREEPYAAIRSVNSGVALGTLGGSWVVKSIGL